MSRLTNVFAYGTLQEPDVIKELIGRVPDIKDAYVDGYVKFFDDDIGYYSAKKDEHSHIHGKVLMDIDETEIGLLDDYEGVSQRVYMRTAVKATFMSGDTVDSQLYVKGLKHFM